jgi:hypothetical protein
VGLQKQRSPCPKDAFGSFPHWIKYNYLCQCLWQGVYFPCVLFSQYWFFFTVIAIQANVRWLKEVCLPLMTFEIQLTWRKRDDSLAITRDRTRRLVLTTPSGTMWSTDNYQYPLYFLENVLETYHKFNSVISIIQTHNKSSPKMNSCLIYLVSTYGII